LKEEVDSKALLLHTGEMQGSGISQEARYPIVYSSSVSPGNVSNIYGKSISFVDRAGNH
jgi:hypothetical protein